MSRGLFPRIRRYGLLYLRTVEYDHFQRESSAVASSVNLKGSLVAELRGTGSQFKLELVRKRSIQVKIGDLLYCVTLKNNRVPLLCYVNLCVSFHTHRSIQTGVTVRKHKIQVKISYILSRVTLKFDGWPWKNNRAPLLCCIEFCGSFWSHLWIQTAVAGRKRPIQVKIWFFCPVWPWNLMDDLEKQSSTSPMPHQVLCIILLPNVKSHCFSLEKAKSGFELCDLDLCSLTLTFCMDITFVNSNNFWKFHVIMTGTLW